MKKIVTITTIIVLLFGLTVSSCFLTRENDTQKATTVPSSTALPVTTADYKPQTFNLDGKLKGLSKKQIDEHKQLYEGYVAKRNEISQKLEATDFAQATNATYSLFRELKLEQTFAGNGDIWHRLYFQNMGSDGKPIGPKTKELFIKNFGSLEKFKELLFATAKSARGWAIVGYTPDDNRVHIFLLDAHNFNVPALMIPLLVLDVYEHAYMIDFGIKRVPYLDVFWDNIAWNVVEHRASFVEKYASQWDDYFNVPK